VAGGWVRDKLMGRQSHDIDVVVQGMRATDFLALVNAHLVASGEQAKLFTTVEADPARGKHLAAHMITIYDVSVDVLDLRGLDLLQDAQERDLTINAMFYNINQGLIEDVTGMGLQDLRNQLLRTPANPVITLDYDPLRALRIARFAAQFSYSLAPALSDALRSPQLRRDLALKTARDRVGVELRKALGCMGPHCCPPLFFQVVVDAGLFEVVFSGEDRPQHEEFARSALTRCQAVFAVMQDGAALIPDDHAQAAMFLAASLWHLWGQFEDTGKRRTPLIQVVVVSALRLSKQLGTDASKIAQAAATLMSMARLAPPYPRLELGRCLRECGPQWTCAWVLAVAVEGAPLRMQLNALWAAVHNLALPGCWLLKPILDGNAIKTLLGIAPGPIFASLTEALIDEQLRRPAMREEEARSWLQDFYRRRTVEPQ
jgi:tRNA nucleotidyltransferase (CCA-adding enzyme)